MSKRGKVFKKIRVWMEDAKPLSERLIALGPKVKALSEEDAGWLFKKIINSEQFKTLPEIITNGFNEEFSDLKEKPKDDDDELPF